MEKKPRYKRPTKRSKYYVPIELWDAATSFCRCYPLWIAELATCDSSRAIRYDVDHVQTSGDSDPTSALAMRRVRIQAKVDIVEKAARETADSEAMAKYLILGVTHRLSYETLIEQGIPCGRRQYHELRREMIYRVSQKL